ncbi:MAG TPA: hypothetical protein VE130_06220 [Nitrososphaeraceae archaeon]|nr:hypothetical protein [Nitrososphaeraceae archaeon]
MSTIHYEVWIIIISFNTHHSLELLVCLVTGKKSDSARIFPVAASGILVQGAHPEKFTAQHICRRKLPNPQA